MVTIGYMHNLHLCFAGKTLELGLLLPIIIRLAKQTQNLAPYQSPVTLSFISTEDVGCSYNLVL